MIDLPEWPAPQGASAAYIDFGGFLTPATGASVQRIDRMGNRFALTVMMPPLDSEVDGRIFVSRLIRGKTEGVRMPVPLLGFQPNTPGSPAVNGGGQSGKSMAINGLTPNYTIREGQWFSHLHDDQHYLYNITAQVTANSSGAATINFAPMLRVEPDDNDELHFTKPMIEGYIHGEEWRWNMSLEHNLGIEFEIRERG